jgi:hypothetical protein
MQRADCGKSVAASKEAGAGRVEDEIDEAD